MPFLMILHVIAMKEERNIEYYLLHPRQPVVIIETLKAEAVIKQRKAELAREFPFKKRGFRKHVR